MKYKRKPIVVEAVRWWKNGDHPDDDATRGGTTPNGEEWEGLVVRYFRRPDVRDIECEQCGELMNSHGWIDLPGGGHVVCPGDYVVTEAEGKRYPLKPDLFDATYEEAVEDPA
jgi:hypothetical protein